MKNTKMEWKALALLLCLCMTVAIFTACMAVNAEDVPLAEEGSLPEAGGESTAESEPETLVGESGSSNMDAGVEEEREVITNISKSGECVARLFTCAAPSYYGRIGDGFMILDGSLSGAIRDHLGEDVLYRAAFLLDQFFCNEPENPSTIEERLQYAESIGIDVKCCVNGLQEKHYFADLSVEDIEALGEFGGFAFIFESAIYLDEDAVILDYVDDAELLQSFPYNEAGALIEPSEPEA